MRAAAAATLTLLILAVAGSAMAQESPVDPNEECLECHEVDAVVEFADGEFPAYVDPAVYLRSVHGHLACIECHTQVGSDEDHPDRDLPDRREYVLELNQACTLCHGTPAVGDALSITQVLHPAATEGGPVCTDCHRAHEMTSTATGAFSISHACQSCHAEIYDDFSRSAHGDALRSDNQDLPSCTSCHSGHEAGGRSPAARRVRLGRPCIGCHADDELMSRYDLSSNVVTSYLSDFHGVSVKFYGEDHRDISRYPMVCADCHGIHDVAAIDTLAPGAMRSRVAEACNKCHEDAATTASFPEAWLSHYEPSLSKNTLVFLVKAFYWVLIPFVIGGLLIHISFHLLVLPIRRWRQRVRGEAPPPAAAPPTDPHVPRFLPRFSSRQRCEHAIVMITFTVLIVTGLPQKFHDAVWATTVVSWLGGIDMVRLIHRVAGWTFAAAALIHFLTVGKFIVVDRMKMTMVPDGKDFRDAITSLRYYLGLAPSMPRADRFDYRQKFEYWGMVLGGVIMAATGFILIYPTFFARYLPGQVIAAAKTAHSYEAMMALLTIIIWHMYGARFDRSIFTGKMEARKLAHHHPLEYERIVRDLKARERADSSRSGPPSTPRTRKTEPRPEPALLEPDPPSTSGREIHDTPVPPNPRARSSSSSGGPDPEEITNPDTRSATISQ